MSIYQSLKHYIRSSFREFFVYHNRSLEFRAKLFAIVVGANGKLTQEYEQIIYKSALKIYNNDHNRATTLMLITKEYVEKINKNNDLGIDELAREIEKSIKRYNRFVYKINTNDLQSLIDVQTDKDIKDYQTHIIEFLNQLKDDYTKKE